MRYVFIRPIKDYLRIDLLPGHIDGPLDEVQDYSGWDVKKALGLLGKSNPSLLEWLHSPVVYAQTAAWRHFADCADAYFSAERNLHHQYASAYSTWRNFLQGEQVRLKKYLYALRPLLCFRYVEQYRKVAPVPFDKLCAAVLPDSMRGVVDDLLAQKKQAREKETAPRIPELDAYLLAEFAHAEKVLEALPNILGNMDGEIAESRCTGCGTAERGFPDDAGGNFGRLPKLSQFRRINIFQTDEHMRVIRFLVRWSLKKRRFCRKQEVCA